MTRRQDPAVRPCGKLFARCGRGSQPTGKVAGGNDGIKPGASICLAPKALDHASLGQRPRNIARNAPERCKRVSTLQPAHEVGWTTRGE
jgi:hypothetical protein